MSRIAFNGNALGTGTVTIASPNTNSDRTVTLPDETGTVVLGGGALGTPSSGNGSNLTNLNASNLASGTVAVARLAATGTPSASTFLRGDSSWETVSTTPTTAQVLSATAGASVGAVGTYAYLSPPNTGVVTYGVGATGAGSSLRYAGSTTTGGGGTISGTAPAGTWRCMGVSKTVFVDGVGYFSDASVWLRIS